MAPEHGQSLAASPKFGSWKQMFGQIWDFASNHASIFSRCLEVWN
jgi:hypothetical protein